MKLVRDNIPALIEAEGKSAITHIASGPEYWKLLKEKLLEEVQEVLTATNVQDAQEELADVIEVIRAMVCYNGLTLEQLEKFRLQKREQRGSFDKRIVLEEVQDS